LKAYFEQQHQQKFCHYNRSEWQGLYRLTDNGHCIFGVNVILNGNSKLPQELIFDVVKARERLSSPCGAQNGDSLHISITHEQNDAIGCFFAKVTSSVTQFLFGVSSSIESLMTTWHLAGCIRFAFTRYFSKY
jgi:hypothetical protein